MPTDTPDAAAPVPGGSTCLLGPQRFLTTAGAVVRGLQVDGPVATVTAGWEERETEDAELDQVMGGGTRNLRLFTRMVDVVEHDPAVADAVFGLRDAVDDLAGAYRVRLQHALEAIRAVRRRDGRADLTAAAVSDAVDTLRRLDQWYLDEVRALHREAPTREVIESSARWRGHRDEVAETLAGCGALAVAGGHVGILLRAIRFLGFRPPDELPVVAWSAGAMVMASTVLLYNDFVPTMSGPEVWDRGLSRIPRVVAIPHARRRLRLDDRAAMEVLARRFHGCVCLVLDDGARVEVAADGALPSQARVVRPDGSIGTLETAAA